jgi:hypothetical protein
MGLWGCAYGVGAAAWARTGPGHADDSRQPAADSRQPDSQANGTSPPSFQPSGWIFSLHFPAAVA